MWHWEVTWKDRAGEIYSSASKQGYGTDWEAQRAYDLGEQDIHEQIANMGGHKIVDVQIVFRYQTTGFWN